MTVLLTVLIWAGADRLVNESATVELTAVPVPHESEAGLVVKAETGKDRFALTVSGPRRTVEAVQARSPLQARIVVPAGLTGTAKAPLDKPTLQLQLSERYAEFSRLYVLDVVPDSLPVQIDRFVERAVQVAARPVELSYETEPQVQKVPVRVRLRESALATLADPSNLQLDVSHDVERLLKEKSFGRPTTVSVPLDARPFGPDAQIQPSALDVTAVVHAVRNVEQIPTVPILVAMSFGNLERTAHAATRDGKPLGLLTQTIRVTGPPDALTKLVRGETRAFGIVQLREDDFQQLGVLKLVTPEFHLPVQIELASDPEPIEFQLLPNAASKEEADKQR